ncbi:uncharacterized protein [Acropora muricata]|uniref:uncharacterized protein n=1 Tax=Acropora muricata TaxID=159855 RepID=UPI0034E51855
METLELERLLSFPFGYFLNLGGWFPVANYPFSETRFGQMTVVNSDESYQSGLPLDVFFTNAIDCVKSKGGTTEEEKKAYQRLDKFLKRDVGKPAWANASNKKDFNAIFANEVIIPLTSSTCIITFKPKNLQYHENVKLPGEYGLGGLVIGYAKSYHGELDMVVFPPGLKKDLHEEPNAVPVTSLTEDDEMAVDPQGQEQDDGYEPVAGEMVEGKSHGGTSLLRHHQSIAALLTFSKIQKSRHLIKSNTFPMLIVSPTDVIILMYQPQTDTLVITQVLPWEKVAYFFVWAVLHHSIFPINMPEAVECGYAKATEDFSFGDYWYLENKTVLQGNNSQEIPKFACTYRFVQDRTK